VTDKFISIEGIARRFRAAGSGATTVFEDLWLSMRRGEFVCVIGHSGCGKTTVLNILAGLDRPSEGTVIVDGQVIDGPSIDRAVIFQSHALLPWRTVMGNVAYAVASKWRRRARHDIAAHAQRFIDLVGLTGAEGKRPAELSGGCRSSPRSCSWTSPSRRSMRSRAAPCRTRYGASAWRPARPCS
jgi:nitrate/nitrite transport system ATP-binding protein